MNPISATSQYLKHRYHARRWDSFHSPHLFELFTYCCNEKNDHSSYYEIEKQRRKFIASQEVINRKDFGVGSVLTKTYHQQKISTIARDALSLPFQCRFLSRLARLTEAKTIVEFGSSFGISAAYMAAGMPEAQIITIEGDPAIAGKANNVFSALGIKNIRLVNSTFEDFISTLLVNIPPIDLLFLDGNHRSEATSYYYKSLLPHLHSNTIVVVDDIHWSDDMHTGWKQLLEMPEITQSVDCFHFGLLFFSPDFLNKESHLIRLPWRSIL